MNVRRPNLDAIRRRAAAATPGPWKIGSKFGSGSLGSSVVALSGKLPPLELDHRRNGRADAAFIAHARQDIPALLEEIDRLRITSKEAAALHRLLDAYLATDLGDPGADDLKALKAKVDLLDQDHAAYDAVFGPPDRAYNVLA